MNDTWAVLRKNPISTFAVILVALIGLFLGYMIVWNTNTLASEAWCAKAIMAEKITPGTSFAGLTACNELLIIQVKAIALNSLVMVGTYSFIVIVLIVVVVARAKATGSLPGGISFNIAGEGQEAIKAADKVATAAVEEAKEVKKDVAATAPKTVPEKTPWQ